MLGPAGLIEIIKSDVDYIDEGIKQDLSPIFTIHCVKTNRCPVTIVTIGNTTATFPPNSFVAGATYHIYIKRMIFDEDLAGFVGYRLLPNKNDN